jgi:hypothetical protein
MSTTTTPSISQISGSAAATSAATSALSSTETSVGTLSLLTFVGITLLYSALKYAFGTVAPVRYGLLIGFVVLTLIVQTGLASSATSTLCGGEVQWGSAFQWGFAPWVVMFAILLPIFTYLPGWKSPFSNTFGYVGTLIMGVSKALNTLLKSNYKTKDPALNKIMENIYEDQSLLVNQFTPENFEEGMKKLLPLMETGAVAVVESGGKAASEAGSIYASAYETLRNAIRLKDEIAEGVWLLLSGILVSSIMSLGVLNTQCTKSEAAQASAMKAHQAAQASAKAAAAPKRTYVSRD